MEGLGRGFKIFTELYDGFVMLYMVSQISGCPNCQFSGPWVLYRGLGRRA